MRLFLATIVLFAALTVRADNTVVGTVSFSLDGNEQTWYVLKSPAGLRPNALWLETGPERAAISVTAFTNSDIRLVGDGSMGSAVPDRAAKALVFSVAFPTGAAEYVHRFPVAPTDGPAVVMLLEEWSNPIDAMMLTDGPGEIRLTSISRNGDSSFTLKGTFEGVLTDGEGNTRTAAAGRFEFEKVEFFERP
ncbi:MAG: hypothetical protein AAF417_09160 [Pseudomonadota bacterium]